MKAKYISTAALFVVLAIVPSAHAYTAGPVQTIGPGDSYPGPSMPGVHHLKKNSLLMLDETILSQQVTTNASDENAQFTMTCPSNTLVAGFVPESNSGSSLPTDNGNWGGNPGVASLVLTLHGTGTSTYYLLCDASTAYKFDTFDYAVPPVLASKYGAWILPPGKRIHGTHVVVGLYFDVPITPNTAAVGVRIKRRNGKVIYKTRWTALKYFGQPLVTQSVKVHLGQAYTVSYTLTNKAKKRGTKRYSYRTKAVK